MARKHTTAFFSDSVKRTNKSGTPRVRGVTSRVRDAWTPRVRDAWTPRVREVLRGPATVQAATTSTPHVRGVDEDARGEAEGFALISPRKIRVTDEEPRRKLVLDEANRKVESHPLMKQFQSLRRISRVGVVERQGRFTRPETRELDVRSPAFKIQAREIHEVAASPLNAVDTATLEKVAVADMVVRSKANFLFARQVLTESRWKPANHGSVKSCHPSANSANSARCPSRSRAEIDNINP
ncbi:hypothetical protein B0H13DRAFT_1851108 [Mycena leptocephala]|nr:hypothetical protein B0H13DRAFT_1851108 [Mycena leptocephala]